MTRKASALMLAACAVLVYVTSASAAAKLPLPAAEKVAVKLAHKAVRGRNIIAFHITAPQRIGNDRIVFRYDDRSRANVYCTALLTVTLTDPKKGTVSAHLGRQSCHGIPADALAFEAVTARAFKGVKARRGAINRSLAAFKRTLAPCNGLKVPARDRGRVRALGNVAAVEALVGPVNSQLSAFVSSLGALKTSNPTLARSQAAWSDYLATLRVLPRVKNACTSARAWARHGWRGRGPIDIGIYNRLNARSNADAAAIKRAAKALAADGVFPEVAVAYTPSGMLLQVKLQKLIKGF